MGKTIAIVQSNYIPWKGYFDLIAAADAFVLLDTVQYTPRDWRNRNRIKTPNGLAWLSIPVHARRDSPIQAVTIADPSWQMLHWKTLQHAYAHAPHFDWVAAWLQPLYLAQPYTHLSHVNRQFIEAIMAVLRIDTPLHDAGNLPGTEGKNARLIEICQALEADSYLTGPSARAYLDEAQFAAAGIAVRWMEYGAYPEYPQCWGEFIHEVSVLDLLMQCGDHARDYMKVPHG